MVKVQRVLSGQKKPVKKYLKFKKEESFLKEHKANIAKGVKAKAKQNPYYNRGKGNSKIHIDRDELYQKYIVENLSTNGCAEHFGVGNKKIWDALQEYGIKKDKDVWKEQLSTRPKKVILQYDLEQNLIKEWACGKDIKNELGINNGSVYKCCRGLVRAYKGFLWRYKDNHIGFDKKPIRNKYRQGVIKYDSYGKEIEKYSSTNETARKHGVTAKKIKRLCEVKEEFNGYYFKFD